MKIMQKTTGWKLFEHLITSDIAVRDLQKHSVACGVGGEPTWQGLRSSPSDVAPPADAL